jgi:hypothetical protein
MHAGLSSESMHRRGFPDAAKVRVSRVVMGVPG